ncbi:iron ABC transporter permease [Paenibacillus athensensis]|uniref:Iron ABC transporter n=2 Tax=Paenibacillus athensensis TaxID=1967502 RepID=A0A4Y8PTK2_9BACL|nr:iron ABC transporter permease [Paenibacillus athensensis]MCD1261757.1 iron ABC transporter permease [Paenibacillus athensensis]
MLAKRSVRFGLTCAAAAALFIATFAISMLLGAADTSWGDVWLALTTQQSGEKLSLIREIRLPREVAAIFVGAALAVSGAVMQGMTRNPLADPGLFGLMAGADAALAVTLALLPAAGYLAVTFVCFVGAAVGSLLVLGLSSLKRGGQASYRIVLAGAAVSAFLYALADQIGIFFKISKDVSLWTAGGMMGVSWQQLQVIVPVVVLGITVALIYARQLTMLSLSEEAAVGLGQRTRLIKTILFLVTVLLAGVSVALVGNLAFVGLMIPHIVRGVVGADYRFVLPLCAVTGASFLLLADTLARTINAPYETPVTAIIAVLGLPFFLLILRKGGSSTS